MTIIAVVLVLACLIVAYVRGYVDASEAAEIRCDHCKLDRKATPAIRCPTQYAKETVEVFDRDFDPTVPTAKELDAQWGFTAETRKGE